MQQLVAQLAQLALALGQLVSALTSRLGIPAAPTAPSPPVPPSLGAPSLGAPSLGTPAPLPSAPSDDTSGDDFSGDDLSGDDLSGDAPLGEDPSAPAAPVPPAIAAAPVAAAPVPAIAAPTPVAAAPVTAVAPPTPVAAPVAAAPVSAVAGDGYPVLDHQNRVALADTIRSDQQLETDFSNWGSLSDSRKIADGQKIAADQGQIYGFTPVTISRDPSLDALQGVLGLNRGSDIGVSSADLDHPEVFINTVTHEETHAFQRELSERQLSTDDPYYGLAQQFAANENDYQDPQADYDAYRNQPVEAHAFATGNEISQRVFGAQAFIA